MNSKEAIGVFKAYFETLLKGGAIQAVEGVQTGLDAISTLEGLEQEYSNITSALEEKKLIELTEEHFKEHPELFVLGFKVGNKVLPGSIQVLDKSPEIKSPSEDDGSDSKDGYPPRTVPFP